VKRRPAEVSPVGRGNQACAQR